MKPKYLVIGGHVYSSHDLDYHYVSPEALAFLYGVSKKDCLMFESSVDYRLLGYRREDFIVLEPRTDGNYAREDE
jgi:hypothetical protein